MKVTPVILAICLMLSGCGGCQRNAETSAPGGAGAGVRAPGAASPRAAEAGKIHVGAPEANAPGQPSGARTPAVGDLPTGPTGAAPGGAPAAGTEPEASDEGDCIVVADANPDYGPPPLSVSFTAEAECSGGQPTYKWDFGDGSPASNEVNPTHTYTKSGEYTASVTVTSGNATASDEIDITLEEGEPPAEP
jgi:hypothetical protein